MLSKQCNGWKTWHELNQGVKVAQLVSCQLWKSSTESGLEIATDTVANATKIVQLATKRFQAVTKLATSSNEQRIRFEPFRDCSFFYLGSHFYEDFLKTYSP